MILILGNSSDSLLYIRTMLRYSVENSEIFGKFKSATGKVFGQDVTIAECGYSSYRASLIASYMIQKYEPYVVIYLGDAAKISKEVQVGEVFMANFIQLADCNQLSRRPDMKLNQVPDFPEYFTVADTLVKLFSESAAHVSVLDTRVGSAISGNNAISSIKDLQSFDVAAFENQRHANVVYEGEIGGVALACSLYQVPVLPIFAISSDANDPASTLQRRMIILKEAVDIGKTVVSFIINISNDESTYIRGDEAAPDQRMKF